MNERARRSSAIGARSLLFVLGTLVLVTGRTAWPGARPPSFPPPAPRIDEGSHHTVELEAQRVDLGHTGAHTHANWVVFELPFATTSPAVKNVRLTPRTLADSDVGALYAPFVCLPAPTLGPLERRAWHKFTVNGIAHTDALATHPYAPTFDPHAYAINVPTRVANAAACGDASALLARETWRLVVAWDEP